jgi:hypothetical protein
MCDLLHFARKLPSVPVQRQMNVSAVVSARADLPPRPDNPGWCAIFAKAYGITASRFPQLRRAYLELPWPHIYEHPCSVVSVALEKEYQGEKAVFWGRLRCPEGQALSKLQEQLTHFKESPIESLRVFRRALQIARLPRPLRRLLWWVGLNYSGRERARRFGTFGISVYSGLGAESLHPISPLTGTCTYGTIGADGNVTVRIIYDHRVLDGANVARALACMEEVLNHEIVEELRQEGARQAA